MKDIADSEYSELLDDIKQQIKLARVKIAEVVAKEEDRLRTGIEQICLAYREGKPLPESRATVSIRPRAVRRKWHARRVTTNLTQTSLAADHESNLLKFLDEMGGIFAFVGSQIKLEVGNKEYFLDILLFHRRLRCPVVLELKAGEFIPEYIGKLQFYLAVVNDQLRLPDETPAIGIILCKSKEKTIVEYSLRQSTSPIGVAEYKTVSTLPDELKGELPSPEQVAILMEGIE